MKMKIIRNFCIFSLLLVIMKSSTDAAWITRLDEPSEVNSEFLREETSALESPPHQEPAPRRIRRYSPEASMTTFMARILHNRALRKLHQYRARMRVDPISACIEQFHKRRNNRNEMMAVLHCTGL